MQARLDPRSGDYDGTRIDHLGNAVMLRVLTPLGSWWADSTLGSRLHLLSREKDLPRMVPLAEQYVREALQPLLDDGRARSIGVIAQRKGGWMILDIDVVDTRRRSWTYQFAQVL